MTTVLATVIELIFQAVRSEAGDKPKLAIAAMRYYVESREGKPSILGIPVMVIFLSSLAALVAVGLATRLMQRDDDYLSNAPSFRVTE